MSRYCFGSEIFGKSNHNNRQQPFTEVEVASGGYIPKEYNFGAQWPNGRGRRFFLPTNKTFEGIFLALAGKFLQKELWILFVFKIIL